MRKTTWRDSFSRLGAPQSHLKYSFWSIVFPLVRNETPQVPGGKILWGKIALRIFQFPVIRYTFLRIISLILKYFIDEFFFKSHFWKSVIFIKIYLFFIDILLRSSWHGLYKQPRINHLRISFSFNLFLSK